MMKLHKVMALPAVREASGIYLVKKDTGIALYVADSAGSAAYTLARKVTIQGPTNLFHGETGTYTINDYSDRLNYTLTSSDGVVARTGNTFTFLVSNTLLTQAKFTLNGREITVVMKPVEVVQPLITAPVNNATSVPVTGTTVFATAFALTYPAATDTHVSSDWELSTDPTFATVVASSYGDTTNKTSWPIPA